MARINVGKGLRYLKNGQMHIILEELIEEVFDKKLQEKIPRIILVVKNLSFGGQDRIFYDDLVKDWGRGEIRFEVIGRGIKIDEHNPLNTGYSDVDYSKVPEKKRRKVIQRHELLLDLFAYFEIRSIKWVSRSDIEAYHAEKIADGKAKKNGLLDRSPRTIERLLKEFILAGGDIRSLQANNHLQGDPGVPKGDPIIYEKIDEVAAKYMAIRHYKKAFNKFYTDVINLIGQESAKRVQEGKEPIKPPDDSTVRRRAIKIGWEKIFGQKPSKQKEKADGVSHAREKTERPLENLQVDGTLLPFFVVDEVDRMPIGRPYLTAGLCTTTELIPCWQEDFNIVKAGYLNVMLMLKHLVLPEKPDYKTLYDVEEDFPVWGLPEMITTDQGTEFDNEYFQFSLGELGILHDPNPAGQPWLNGKIERVWWSIAQQLLDGMPGYIGSNSEDFGYFDPQEVAVISNSAYREMLHQFLIDIYPHTTHSTLGLRPMTVYKRLAAIHKPHLSHSARETELILLPFFDGRLQAQGVPFQTIWYTGPELLRLRKYWGKNPLRIKQDPDDMHHVYVPDPQAPDGYAKFESIHEYTKGLTLAKHRFLRSLELRETAADRIDVYVLERRKGKLAKIVEREFHLTKSLKKRSETKSLMDQIRNGAREERNVESSQKPLELPLSKPEDFYDMDSPAKPWRTSYNLPTSNDD